jgi:hypothetical protein
MKVLGLLINTVVLNTMHLLIECLISFLLIFQYVIAGQNKSLGMFVIKFYSSILL